MDDRIEIEVLSGDGWTAADTADPEPRPPRRRRGRDGNGGHTRLIAGVGLIGALAVAVTLASRSGSSDRNHATFRSDASTAEASTAGSTVAFSAASSASEPAADFEAHPSSSSIATPITVAETKLGALLPAPSGTTLVARTAGSALVELDVDLGALRRIDIRSLDSSGAGVFLVAGSDWLVERPFDNIAGYLVRGGNPDVSPLAGALSDGTFGAFPGPADATVWVTARGTSDAFGSLVLVDLEGRPTGPRISLDGLQPIGSDGTGGVLLAGAGGVYQTDGAGMKRVTMGSLVAVGPTAFVTVECDDAHLCQLAVIDRATGARRLLRAVTPEPYGSTGVVSPDGSRAAYVRRPLNELRIVDLTSGAETTVSTAANDQGPFESAPIWSVDGRFLFFVDDQGLMSAWDSATGAVSPLHPALPHVLELTARPRH